MRKISNKLDVQEILIVIAIIFVLIGTIAETTFKFRHPCLTHTEIMMHYADIIQFKHYPDLCKPR